VSNLGSARKLGTQTLITTRLVVYLQVSPKTETVYVAKKCMRVSNVDAAHSDVFSAASNLSACTLVMGTARQYVHFASSTFKPKGANHRLLHGLHDGHRLGGTTRRRCKVERLGWACRGLAGRFRRGSQAPILAEQPCLRILCFIWCGNLHFDVLPAASNNILMELVGILPPGIALDDIIAQFVLRQRG